MSPNSCSSAPERYPRRLSARQFEAPKRARRPFGHRAVWEETPNVGSVRRRDEQWSPNAHPLRPSQRGPASRRRISMRRKPSHPDAEGIADDGGDENGKHQRPAAKVAIEVHRMPLDFNPPPTILLAS